MGAPKQKWTPEEEDALRAGVEKHGPGKWRTIQKDPEFSHFLSTRSNIDLKDKWRNMSVSAGGQGSREKSRSSKNKAILATSLLGSHGTVSTSVKEGTLSITLDQAKNFKDGSAIPRYAQLIVEALKAMPDSEGMPISAICNYIEQRLSVPPNFRRLLSSKLRRLVAQNKIIKGPRGYMLKESSFATKTPTPKQKDLSHHRPKMSSHSPSFSSATSRTDEASKTAAYRIAEAEAKMYLASEAVKEAETVSRMAEETDSLLLIAKEIYERCLRGEIVTIA